uniref:Uncharacterized protein n=1 Tax=Helianthus annuus TaxID=4232 RepID=A0A251TLW0_HELAN
MQIVLIIIFLVFSIIITNIMHIMLVDSYFLMVLFEWLLICLGKVSLQMVRML